MGLAVGLVLEGYRSLPEICAPLADEYAPEHEALRRATALARHIGDFSLPFLQRLDEFADLFVCHVDGWWEFFSGRVEWYERLRAAWPECRERDLSQASLPP